MRTRHSYYYSYYYVFTYTPIDHSKHGTHYLRRTPFLPYMGARAGIQDLTATLRQSTVKWKHGTNGRQGKIGNQGL